MLSRWASKAGIALLVAVFILLATPLRDALLIGSFLLMPDHEPESGAAVVLVRNLDHDEVRLVSLKMDGVERLAEAADGRGWPLGARDREQVDFAKILVASAGLRRGSLIVVRDGHEAVFDFEIELVAGHQCDLRIELAAAGTRAERCAGHRRASYGGIARH